MCTGLSRRGEENRQAGKATERKRGPCGGAGISVHRLAAHVSEQKTCGNNPGHRGQREPPKMQLAQTCGVTDHIEGQKRQQATAEDQEGQSVLRSEQACVNHLTEMTLNEGTTQAAGQTKGGKRTEFRT